MAIGRRGLFAARTLARSDSSGRVVGSVNHLATKRITRLDQEAIVGRRIDNPGQAWFDTLERL